MPEPSDPKIVERLKGLPPYEEEKPLESPPVEVKPSEPPPETPEEPKEEPKIVEPAAKTEITEKEALDNSKNPERTGEYIKKLKDENASLKRKNILDSFIPEPLVVPNAPTPPTTNVIPTQQQFPGLPQKQIDETFKGLVDDAGYVDTGLLISTLKELKEKNRLAEERANQAEAQSKQAVKRFDDFERNEIMRKVHDRFPKVNPDNVGENIPEEQRFDERVWKYVRNEVVDQWMNGKPTDVEAAAQEAMDTFYPMKKVDKVKLAEAEKAKKNINALSGGQARGTDYSDHEALVKATMLGKKGALAERLKKAGF